MRLLTSLFGATLYVQVASYRLRVRNPGSGAMFSEPPELALARFPKGAVVGVGFEAQALAGTSTAEVVNPFGHPRSLISDCTVAAQLLRVAFRKVNGGAPPRIAPRVVMHPLGEPVGGFTRVEIRALQELAMMAGAGRAQVWEGRALTDEELLAGTFSGEGRVLA